MNCVYPNLMTVAYQLYNFEDKGGRRVVLRPEITPSLARLVMKQGSRYFFPFHIKLWRHKFEFQNIVVCAVHWNIWLFLLRKSASFPLKWFTIGQCWRYERMTRGRRREHYQWNMDIIGISKVRVCIVHLNGQESNRRSVLNWYSLNYNFSWWSYFQRLFKFLVKFIKFHTISKFYIVPFLIVKSWLFN